MCGVCAWVGGCERVHATNNGCHRNKNFTVKVREGTSSSTGGADLMHMFKSKTSVSVVVVVVVVLRLY